MSLERLRRSFAGWTASRWLSSWPRHGFAFFPLRKSPTASMIICDCCEAVTSQTRATRPFLKEAYDAVRASPPDRTSFRSPAERRRVHTCYPHQGRISHVKRPAVQITARDGEQVAPDSLPTRRWWERGGVTR